MPKVTFIDESTEETLWEAFLQDGLPKEDESCFFGEVGGSATEYNVENVYHDFSKPATDDPQGVPSTTMCQHSVRVIVSEV